MYDFIQGKIAYTTSVSAVIETGGIGYILNVPLSAFTRLPHPGTPIRLYTSFVVREQSQALYGFLSREERDLFEQIMGISGIGPKLALSILGHLSPENLFQAVVTQDLSALCRAPGIGKKMAQRLLLELKDKIDKVAPQFQTLPLNSPGQIAHDALNALLNLGYQKAKAQQAIAVALKEQPESNLTAVITASLKLL